MRHPGNHLTGTLLAAFLLLPGPVLAQQLLPGPVPPQDGRQERSVSPTTDEAGSGLLTALAGRLVWAQAEPAQNQVPPLERRRRRPSMVGYINDAGVQTQVRLRFDAGTGIDAPDRAEFFYAKCGCYRFLPADHPAFDPDAPGPGPGITTSLNFQQLYAQAELAVHDRVSVYGELPIRWIRPQGFVPDTGSFGNQSGLSDLRAGVKLALIAEDARFLTLQLQGNLPSGDGLKGLGVEHFSFEPALLYSQGFNDRVNLEGQFGVVLPTGGSDGIATTTDRFSGNVLYYGIGPSVEVYRGTAVRFAPVVELIGWRVLGGFQTSTLSEADGVNIVNLKVGGRFELRNGNSIYVGYGHGLTDSVWYDDLFRMEYRFGF